MHTLAFYRIMPSRDYLRSSPSYSLRWLNVLSHSYHLLVGNISTPRRSQLKHWHDQSYKSMRRWNGCMSTLAKFYGVLVMPVIVFTLSSMVDCVPSRKTTKESSRLLQSMAKVILLARSMSSQALLAATRCMPSEIRSSYGCRRPSSMPYPRGEFLNSLNQISIHARTRNPQTTAL